MNMDPAFASDTDLNKFNFQVPTFKNWEDGSFDSSF